MVNELSRGIQALAAMTEEARSVGLAIEIEKEGAIDHCQTTVKNIETVLQLNCIKKGRKKNNIMAIHTESSYTRMYIIPKVG